MHIHIGILLILVILLNVNYKSHCEYFDNNSMIILMGDSIFKNNMYVRPHQSIEYLLKKAYHNSRVVAHDYAHINDLYGQYKHINQPIDKHTRIFISVGGNNIIDYNLTPEDIPFLFKTYTTLIHNLFPNVKQLYLCTIYYPPTSTYHKYYKHIAIWNKLLKQFTETTHYKLFEIHTLLKYNDDFVNIEPSYIGGKKLVKKILST